MVNANILVVDDNKDILSALTYLLDDEYENIRTIDNPKEIPSMLRIYDTDIVILDMNFTTGELSGEEGLKWLKFIQNFDKDIVVIIITAYGDIELAVRAVREGAFDFVPKPWDNEKMIATINAAFQFRKVNVKLNNTKAQKELYKNELDKDLNSIVGTSPQMQNIIELIHKVAPTDANILIGGENGTGKSLIARYIHNISGRRNNDFVNVDLGALNESLFESELFGYMRGAFTDAKKDHPGRFEVANNGTIFLDEISNLPLALQPKLLSIIQNRKVSRLGAHKEIDLDIRLITASNKNLLTLVQEGNFREDLLYRINTIQIELPPLRDRKNDVFELAELFLTKYQKKYRKNNSLSQAALNALRKYNWPGNIRELDHTIEKAIILCNNNLIEPDDLFLNKKSSKIFKSSSIKTLDEIEKQAILNSLENHNWNITEAAKELSISRQSIYNKMKKYDL
jgi:DNA-binding NtrC family response regulator